MAVNTYETVFIAEPEITPDNVEALVGKVKQIITTHQGNVTGDDRWGRRRLAYPIESHREGFYVVLNYTAEPTASLEIERLFNVTDAVIRQLTTRVIKHNKTFAPRRERPAGAVDVHARPGNDRRPGSNRPRSDSPRPASSAPAAAPAAAASTPSTAAPAAAPAAAPVTPPEGGTPA